MVCKVQRPISIPEPTNDVDSLWRTTQVLKEAVEIIQGIRGNREYALKCDLDDINAAVTNITVVSTPGEGSDLEFGGSQYDMLYNTNGATWGNTGGQLQWNPSSKSLQLNNDIAISWLNAVSYPIKFLSIDSDEFTVGDSGYVVSIEASSVNMLNAVPIRWKDSFNGNIEVLNFRSDEFLAGSTFYPTRLEGTLVGLRNGIGLNWEDIDGGDVELAILNDLGNEAQSDYGTSLSAEWSYDSEVSTVVEMKATGIGQDFQTNWVMTFMDISPDGLHWVNGTNNNDQINTYTLDTAYDPGFATSDLPAGWAYTNPAGMRFTGGGNYVTHMRQQRDGFIILTCDSPYTITTSGGPNEGIAISAFGLEPEACFMMTEDGSKVLVTAEKAGGIVWMQMYDTVAPYTLTGMTLASELNIDATFPQSVAITRLQLSPDGLSIMMMFKAGDDRIYLWTLGTAFDVSTATVDTVNPLNLDDGLNGTWYDFVLTPDANTIYAVKGGDYSVHRWLRSDPLPTPSLGSEFTLGDPSSATRVDGTLVGLRNNVGINWEDTSGEDVELAIFTEPAFIDGVLDPDFTNVTHILDATQHIFTANVALFDWGASYAHDFPRSTGKYAFEMTGTNSTSNARYNVGVSNGLSIADGDYIGKETPANVAWGYLGDGYKTTNGGFTNISLPMATSGSTVMIYVDMDAGTIGVKVDNGTETSMYTGATFGTIYPGVGVKHSSGTGEVCTINLGDSDFVNTLPLGYSAWVGSGDQEFIVGDPAFPTYIDGTLVGLKNDIGVNWEDEAGAETELLIFSGGESGDIYWDETILVCEFEGTDGQTTSTDESQIGNVLTLENTAEIDTANFKVGTSSLLLDGNSDYVSMPDDPAWSLGSGDWTFEAWVMFTNSPSSTQQVIAAQATASGTYSWSFEWYNGDLRVVGSTNGTTYGVLGQKTWTASPTAGQWYHVAFCRLGSQSYGFIDGVPGNLDPFSGTLFESTSDVRVGSRDGTQFYFDGQIDHLRLTAGVARYPQDSSFTPSVDAYPLGLEGATEFVVGDPAFDTRIEGLTTQITSASTDIDGTLDVDGAVALQDTLDVVGAATFQSSLSILNGADSAVFSHDGQDLNTDFTNTTDWNITSLGTFSLFDAAEFIIYDLAGIGHVSHHHDGTNFDVATTLTTDWWIRGLAGNFWLRDGAGLKISDGSNQDFAIFSHDGSDFILDFTNTNNVKITGTNTFFVEATGQTGQANIGVHSFLANSSSSIWSYNEESFQYLELNIYGSTSGNSPHLYYSDPVNDTFELQGDSGIITRWIDTATKYFDLVRGTHLRIYNTTTADFADFSHDGTDFNTDFTGTTSWNISDLATINLRDGPELVFWNSTNVNSVAPAVLGTVFDIDNTNITDWQIQALTGNFWLRDGAGLKISDPGDTDWAIFSHDGSDFNTAFTTTADWNVTGITAIVLTGAYQVSDAAGPTMVDEAATSTNPTLIPNIVDLDSGLGWAAEDQPVVVAGGVEAIRYSEASSHVMADSQTHTGITAGTTQTQADGFQLLSSHNEVATVANTNDTVVAPLATVGRMLTILNNGANTLQIFPAVGDDIGGGVDTAITLATGGKHLFISYDATTWTQFV